MGVNRSTIQRAYKQLGLDSTNKKTPRYAHKTIDKKCSKCKIIKPINQFRKRIKGDRASFEAACLDCEKLLNNKRLKLRAKTLRQTDPNFKIRKNISYAIWEALNISNSSKNNESCIKYLLYTIQVLKEHLQKQFEPWMSWNNYGSYNKDKWDDHNSLTWTWNIDHIIPQSKLPYTSMEDDNFKKCWALENLQPLSAKQNILLGDKK